MIRRFASVFGTIVLVFAVGLLVIFGRYGLVDPITAAVIGGLVLAALLSIIGSVADSIAIGRRAIPWNVLVGTANIVLSVAVVLLWIRTAVITNDVSSWLVAAAMLTSGISVSWQGSQIARNSHHVDLNPAPSSRRFVTITLLLAGSVGIGLFAVASM
ncbi:hypothetical protein [Natrinema gelatinilyticum]|uniref:hypothetical protein n=1 Tax=Natrinema gelatinilyticum TaxID=2961571 RepID=UPI0020C29C0B|nr:hypothetical protein [Natrinema gelatinilyticum]